MKSSKSRTLGIWMILIGIVVLAIFSQKDEELDSDEIFSHYEKVGWSRFTEDLGSKKITQIIVYSDVGLLLAFTTDQKYYRTDDLLDTLNDEEQALLDDVEDVMHLSATEMSEAPSGSDAVGKSARSESPACVDTAVEVLWLDFHQFRFIR